jgi:23S rRNA pseudouridine1911/1915/1917 synthase
LNKEFVHIVTGEQKGQRLDQFIPTLADLTLSRSHVKKLIEDGLVSVNDRAAEPSYKIKAEDRIEIIIPPPREPTLKPENIPLDIIYEDADIIVVNKPKGMVVHPAPGNYSGTLVNALLYHCDHLAALGAPLRPGIVHRLDKDTSGLLVAAKTDAAYLSLVKQFKDRTVDKTYVTLVHGTIKNDDGVIEARLGRHPVERKKMAVLEGKGSRGQGPGAREAYTAYKVLKRYKNYTLLEVKIKTGRTHQIRVHMSHIGHPVVGDQTYGKRANDFGVSGQLLQAKKLAFDHPSSGKRMEFAAPLAAVLQKIA